MTACNVTEDEGDEGDNGVEPVKNPKKMETLVERIEQISVKLKEECGQKNVRYKEVSLGAHIIKCI